MTIGLVGRKCGMTRVFTEAGESMPVTVVEVLANRVTQVKDEAVRRLSRRPGDLRQAPPAAAVQGRWPVITPRPRSSRVAPWSSSGSRPARPPTCSPAPNSRPSIFKAGQMVDVTGTTIGKGFAGTMKRHNFAGGPASHGHSVTHRAPGSIGQRQTPGRVFPGKRMSGHMGVMRRTTENLQGHRDRCRAQLAADQRRRAGLRGWRSHRAAFGEGGPAGQAQEHCAEQEGRCQESRARKK